MGNVVLDIAKEISLAIIAKFSIPGAPHAEDSGERYGKLIQNVLKQVVDGLEEVGYIEPDNQENLRGTGQLLRMYEEPVKPAQDIILARLNAIRQKFNILEQQIEPDNQENLRGAGELLPGRLPPHGRGGQSAARREDGPDLGPRVAGSCLPVGGPMEGSGRGLPRGPAAD